MKRVILPILCFGLLSTLCLGQTNDPLGSSNPAKYALADLPADWVAVELTTTKDNLLSLFMMSTNSIAIRNDSDRTGLTPSDLLEMRNCVWVAKDQVLNGGEFLIGYKFDATAESIATGASLASPSFRITYVRRSSIISITPMPEFSPDRLREVMKKDAQPVGTIPQRTMTLSNIKQVCLGVMMWSADMDDIFPYVESSPQLGRVIQPYIRNIEIFKSLNPRSSALRFNMCLAGVNASTIQDPASIPLVYEAEPWEDGKRCVGFADGHAKVVSAEEWDAMQPFLKLKLPRKGKPIPPVK